MLSMAAVVPALVVFVAQASTPRYFTNAENVRRIAAGKRFVAFATSGGVRVFERTTQTWRLYTQNDGLPTHNIHDVVFDSAKPDTLWVLCGAWGDWANEQPEPDLRLCAIDLATGKVEPVSPPTPAPRTARMGYHFFLDYRLSVSEGWAFVFTDKGAALAWDRAAKKWTRQVTVEAPPPRASHYPGRAESLRLLASTPNLIGFFVKTAATYFNQSTATPSSNGGSPIITNRPKHMDELPNSYILLYNRQTGRITHHLLGDDLLEGSFDVVPGSNGKTSRIHVHGYPLRLLPDNRPDTLLIESLESEAGNELEDRRYRRVLYRVSPSLKEPVKVSRQEVSLSEARSIYNEPRNESGLTYFTDFLVDGNTLWLSGYNDTSRPQSSGIARLDLTTGKWERFKPATTGIAANFTRLESTRQGVISTSSLGLPTRYDPKLDDFTAPQNLSQADFYDFSILPDPRAPLKAGEEASDYEWIPLSVLGRDGSRALVRAPSKPTPMFERDANGNVTGPGKRSGPDVLFSYDTATKKLTKLELLALEDLQPRAAGFGENALFFLTEQRAPGERRGASVVMRWDTTTGAVKRYPEALFRDVSVAAQRLSGVRQQVDLKKRQKERNEQLRRFPGAQLPAVELRPAQEFLQPLRGRFLSAAKTTWLRLDQHLFRYDSARDTWLAEGLADSVSAEGEAALWKQAGPELWRFESFEARRLRGEIARWSTATGWQKLELGERARQAGNSVLFHDGALWLSGVGVLRLPQSAWVFRKAR